MQNIQQLYPNLQENIETIQKIDVSAESVDGYQELQGICSRFLPFTLQDLDGMSAPLLSLLLKHNHGLDLEKGLVALAIWDKLLEMENNLFCIAVYRKNIQEFEQMLLVSAQKQEVSLSGYVVQTA